MLETPSPTLREVFMHRLMAGVTILEHELSELRLLAERQAGILLDCPNSVLAAHVADYLEKHELESPAALLEHLSAADQDPALLPEFLDGVLNANTGFFRHPGAMNALARHVVPQLCARKTDDSPATLRIWSAGCGTGEESYSIAMALCSVLPNGNANSAANGNGNKNGSARNGGILENGALALAGTKEWSIHIVGSDLLPGAIKVAERGLYPQSELAGLPPATIRACFSKIGSPAPSGSADATSAAANGAYLLVKPRLRSMVTFNTMNLIRPVYIGRFDCIFCMDVLPHLSRAQRSALIERLHLYLEPGGYLFVSQTEKLCTSNLNFRQETFDGYTVHRKPLAASAAYGR